MIEKITFISEEVKARQIREQTINIIISEATDKERKLVEDATGLRIVPSLVPIFEATKRQRIEHESTPAATGVSNMQRQVAEVSSMHLVSAGLFGLALRAAQRRLSG